MAMLLVPVMVLVTACGGDAAPTATWELDVDTSGWVRVPHDEAVFGGDGSQKMNSVVVGGPGLVAVGFELLVDPDFGLDWDAAVWTSPDGINWSRVPHNEHVFGGDGHQEMSSVVVGGPGLVAVGYDATSSGGLSVDEDAAVWTSPDGLSWYRVPHKEAVFGGDGGQVMVSVVATDSGLVAVGHDESGGDKDAAVWTSPDGLDWSRVPHDEAVFGGEDRQKMIVVAVKDPGLVAVGGDELNGEVPVAVWTSPDGTTWTQVPHDEVAQRDDYPLLIPAVAVLGGVSDDFAEPLPLPDGCPEWGGIWSRMVWTSPDGITWLQEQYEEAFSGDDYPVTKSMITVGSGLVAVGYDVSAGDPLDWDAAVWYWTPEQPE